MSTQNKLLTLAFHPTTPEPEAIVAFLKARNTLPQGFVFNVPNITGESKIEKQSVEYTITLQTHKVPHLFTIFNLWGRNKESFKYDIDIDSDSWTALGSIKLSLKVWDKDITSFKQYFTAAFNKIK